MEKSVTAGWIKPVARAGLITKGVVYSLIGILAFMAAFHIGGQTSKDATKKGVMNMVEEGPAGKVLLGIIVLGLFCYAVWRVVQALTYKKGGDNKVKSLPKKGRYIFSGLTYLSLAVLAVKVLFKETESKGNSSNQQVVNELLHKPMGQWLVGLLALVMAGVGVYQLYYGLSEKYKKHVSGMNLHAGAARLLTRSGKVGYVARGIVWLVIAWLLSQAALHANASEAGDTGKAFSFLQSASYGTYLLGALGLGLLCYGFFNFVRARYETFN